MEQEEQFASRKTSRSQVISWYKAKIRSIYKGQGKTKMATQDVDCTTALVDYHSNLPRWGGVVGGSPQQSATASFDSNMQIAIAAKLLVQSKILEKQKGNPD